MTKNIFLFVLPFLLMACGKTGSQETTGNSSTISAEVAKPLPRFFYQKLAGKIGDNMSIMMDITRQDTHLRGHYIYLSKKQPIQLEGTIDKNGDVNLREYVTLWGKDRAEDKVTGQFVGKMDSKGFKGLWSNGGKSFPFELAEAKEKNYAQLSYESHNKSYQAKGNEGSGTATIDYSYFQIVDCGNETAKAAINQAIMKRVLWRSWGEDSKPAANIDNMMEEFISSYRQDAKDMHMENAGEMQFSYDHILSMQVEHNGNQLLAISYFISTYMGGAHPNSGVEYDNYDLRTGNILTLDEVLVTGYKTKLLPIAEKLFREQNGLVNKSFSEEGYFDMGESTGKFTLTDNVSFQDDALLFTYSQYEIAAYAVGMPEVKVPYTAIKNLIKKEGALGWVL